ncbi:MAG: hypothetical protein FJ280_29430, partial [Planctomycetes bacterium]|nr:hypothetical protein [Planctomycetota bacterium]
MTPDPHPNGFRIIEYIPPGTMVADAGSGQVIHNTIWWTVPPGESIPEGIRYTLAVSPEHRGTIAFSGYLYRDKTFAEILGARVVFEEAQPSPADVADRIETIELFAGRYSRAENVSLDNQPFPDGSGRPVFYDPMLRGGLVPHPYMFPYSGYPEHKAKWVVGSVPLAPGRHRLRLSFPPMDPAPRPLDQSTDGRPSVVRVIVTNYPGLTVPGLAEPHHLDAYEHAPAMLVHRRRSSKSADGCLEMTFEGTFYSMSQGNELYFADARPWPKPGAEDSRFRIIALEPEVFHLPPEGEQDFVLTVRSREPVPDDYSELVLVWLQGVPASPARKPYLFSTTQRYFTLPPWAYNESFWIGLGYHGRMVGRDIMDPPEAFLPSREDLGFARGRYARGVVQYFEDQVRAGKLPSVARIFAHNGWDYERPYQGGWEATWTCLLSSLYHRDTTALQAKQYALRLAEQSVFYPVRQRWDWARPQCLPTVLVSGFHALTLALRASREHLVTGDEQF